MISCSLVWTDICASSLRELELINLVMMADPEHLSAGIWATLLGSLIAREICMGSGLRIRLCASGM